MPDNITEQTKSYYKYCPIYNHDKLDEEYSLINLFANQVTFSRRSNFNDLFDSKVDFVTPTKMQIKSNYNHLKGQAKRSFKELYMGAEGEKNIKLLKKGLNDILDKYLFYCLTSTPTNNLMWSHYANSHNGFCIEWDASYIKPDKVKYQSHIPRIDLLKVINSPIHTQSEIGKDLWHALRIKLLEWRYEEEYRFQLGNNMQHLIVKDLEKMAIIKAEPHWIKSIIFGYRMPQKTREHIKNNLPKTIKFKEIYIAPNKSELIIK